MPFHRGTAGSNPALSVPKSLSCEGFFLGVFPVCTVYPFPKAQKAQLTRLCKNTELCRSSPSCPKNAFSRRFPGKRPAPKQEMDESPQSVTWARQLSSACVNSRQSAIEPAEVLALGLPVRGEVVPHYLVGERLTNLPAIYCVFAWRVFCLCMIIPDDVKALGRAIHRSLRRGRGNRNRGGRFLSMRSPDYRSLHCLSKGQ